MDGQMGCLPSNQPKRCKIMFGFSGTILEFVIGVYHSGSVPESVVSLHCLDGAEPSPVSAVSGWWWWLHLPTFKMVMVYGYVCVISQLGLQLATPRVRYGAEIKERVWFGSVSLALHSLQTMWKVESGCGKDFVLELH